MKINPSKLGLSFGLVAAVLWVVCSLLVMLMPMEMMSMTGNMVHSDLSNMHWDMGAAGLFVGLVAWSITACVSGYLIALIYNKLAD